MANRPNRNTTPETNTEETKVESTTVTNGTTLLGDMSDAELANAIRSLVLVNGNGKVTAEYRRAPFASLKAIVQSGHNHQFGNVPQSGRSGEVKRILAKAKGGDAKATDYDGKAVTAWGKANPEAFEQLLRDYETKELKDFYEGNIGVRSVGPRLSEEDREYNKEILAFIDGQLKANNLSWPPKDDSATISFADGQTRTYSQLIERANASQGERIRAKVRAEMERKAAERAAEAAQAAQHGAPQGI